MSKKKKSCKVESFLQQVKQGPYYICIICHRSLHQRSIRFCKHKNYQILTSELYHLVKSFEEKLYIFESSQAVYNEIAFDPIPDEFKN